MRALEYFAPDPAPLPHEIMAYLADRARTGTATSTLYAYKRDLLDLATYLEESTGKPFATNLLTTQLIVDYKSYLRLRRLSSRTINRRLAALGGLLRWARALGLAHGDPLAGVAPARLTPAPPRSLAPAERARLLDVVERAHHVRNSALVAVLLHCGLRISELVALRLGDVDLVPGGENVLVRSGKGDRDRVVPLNSDARAALLAWLAVRPVDTGDYVFVGQRGGGLAANTVQDLLRRYGERAGIAHLTPHVLRHSFARALIVAGIDIVTVARLLGHSSVVTTQVYTQPTAAEMREAVERLAGRTVT